MKTMTKVGDVMTRRVLAAREDAEFKLIVEVMRANHISALPVVDAHNRVLGVVSEGDLLAKEAAAAQRAGWHRPRTAAERKAAADVAVALMTRPAVTIGQDASVAEAARLMSSRRLKRLPVTDEDGHLIGIVSRLDVLSVFTRPDYDIRDEIVSEVLLGDFAVDPSAFDIEVRSGIVTITGQAESKAVALRLLDGIRHVEAVVDVRDRLSYPEEDEPGPARPFAFTTFPPKG
jgi:CBS-domain-containing membrane protein